MAADTIRIKARVAVGGLRPGQVADVRAGYAKTLIKVGYATRLDNLAAALSAEPLKYGDWEDDPRASTEDEPEDYNYASGHEDGWD